MVREKLDVAFLFKLPNCGGDHGDALIITHSLGTLCCLRDPRSEVAPAFYFNQVISMQMSGRGTSMTWRPQPVLIGMTRPTAAQAQAQEWSARPPANANLMRWRRSCV